MFRVALFIISVRCSGWTRCQRLMKVFKVSPLFETIRSRISRPTKKIFIANIEALKNKKSNWYKAYKTVGKIHKVKLNTTAQPMISRLHIINSYHCRVVRFVPCLFQEWNQRSSTRPMKLQRYSTSIFRARLLNANTRLHQTCRCKIYSRVRR